MTVKDLELPQTIYAVALLYSVHQPATGGGYLLFARPITVSGINPLKLTEVVARARAEVEADWATQGGAGAPADWEFQSASVSGIVQGNESHLARFKQ